MYSGTLNGDASRSSAGLTSLQAGLHAPGMAVVCGIIQETRDTRSLLLDPQDGMFDYQAGQYLTVEAPLDLVTQRRCYSFSSTPAIDARPMVTVKRVPGGAVSNWLHDHITLGSRLRVSAPAGVFTLTDAASAKLRLFGAGSGITPLMSLLKAALFGSQREIQLFYANRSRVDTVFAEQLELLASQHRERFELIYHYDDRDGIPDERAISSALSSHGSSEIYLCGPSPFVALVERCAQQAAPDAQLYIERFSASSQAAVLPPPAAVEASVEWVVAGGSTQTFRCLPTETLLEASRRAGYDPAASCEAGYCGSCTARLVSGEVDMRVCDALNARKRREGWILPCQASALTAHIKLVSG